MPEGKLLSMGGNDSTMNLIDIPKTQASRYKSTYFSVLVNCKDINSFVFGATSGTSGSVYYYYIKGGSGGSISSQQTGSRGTTISVDHNYDLLAFAYTANSTEFYIYFPT